MKGIPILDILTVMVGVLGVVYGVLVKRSHIPKFIQSYLEPVDDYLRQIGPERVL
jgi:ribose/xylose/arabinose/galactoside ABC-type transport system permease subunit